MATTLGETFLATCTQSTPSEAVAMGADEAPDAGCVDNRAEGCVAGLEESLACVVPGEQAPSVRAPASARAVRDRRMLIATTGRRE
ncbi:hypothetical protein GCM10027030_17250 [Luteococcus sediminum]